MDLKIIKDNIDTLKEKILQEKPNYRVFKSINYDDLIFFYYKNLEELPAEKRKKIWSKETHFWPNYFYDIVNDTARENVNVSIDDLEQESGEKINYLMHHYPLYDEMQNETLKDYYNNLSLAEEWIQKDFLIKLTCEIEKLFEPDNTPKPTRKG
ncbi:hypothetical protein [Mycoplasmopsis iners]|uniref:hypothetical protein n=1 Tax=Mycoplasmopsis iners TaxID=76630 RepID=UPI0004977D53|nr:hypothetical protein [Mycoplasmopsis iners]